MSTQITWVSVVRRQKKNVEITPLPAHAAAYFRKIYWFFFVCVCFLSMLSTEYAGGEHIKHVVTATIHRRGWFLGSICHLQLLVLCMRGFPFQLMKFWSYPKAREKEVWALHLQPIIWRMVRIFKAARTPHPSSNLTERAPRTDTHLLHICQTVCVCAWRLCASW